MRPTHTQLPCPSCGQSIRITVGLEMTRCPSRTCKRWLVVRWEGSTPSLRLHTVMDQEDELDRVRAQLRITRRGSDPGGKVGK